MEMSVLNGMRVDYLKYMVKCALLKNDFALAQRYIDVLKKTLFHKRWTECYQSYIDNPQLMENDSEFKVIKPLMNFENRLESDGNRIEAYLLNILCDLESKGNQRRLENSIQSSLLLKDLNLFWSLFLQYYEQNDTIPLHYQEAAFLYSSYSGTNIKYLNLNDDIRNRFNTFGLKFQQSKNFTFKQNQKSFKPLYGKTYWYYYFFNNDLGKTEF